MNRGWLTYLLVFSLALNLGITCAFIYHRYQDRQQANLKMVQQLMPLRDLWSMVKLDPAQQEAIQSLLPEHRRLVSETRQALAQKRQELFELMANKVPLDSAILAKVQEISDLQRRLEQEMVRLLLEVKQHLKPKQEAAFLAAVQGRLCGSRGGQGPGHGGGKGAGPGHHGLLGPPSGRNEAASPDN